MTTRSRNYVVLAFVVVVFVTVWANADEDDELVQAASQGKRWNEYPVKFYVNPQGAPAHFTREVEEAVLMWAQIGLPVQYGGIVRDTRIHCGFVAKTLTDCHNGKDGRNVISWSTDNINPFYYNARRESDVYAQTMVWCEGGVTACFAGDFLSVILTTEISETDIVINGPKIRSDQDVFDLAIPSITAHEIGHALGFEHPGLCEVRNIQSIMASSCFTLELTQYDCNEAHKKYPEFVSRCVDSEFLPSEDPKNLRESAQLLIDGRSYSTKKQGSTFKFEAWGFYPGHEVVQVIKYEDEPWRRLPGTVKPNSTERKWTKIFSSDCSTRPGKYTLYWKDESANIRTNEVKEFVEPNEAMCKSSGDPPPSQPPVQVAPVLMVDGNTKSSTRTQLSTFVLTGTGFTPSGNIKRFIRFNTNQQQEIATMTASSNGSIASGSWNWTPQCSDPPGTYIVWAVDGRTGIQSNVVQEIVTANPQCESANRPDLTVREHIVTDGYVRGVGPNPPKSNFTSNSTQVCSYVRLEGQFVGGHEYSWRYITPNGRLHAEDKGILPAGNNAGASCIPISGTAAAQEHGEWEIEFRLEGELRFTDPFWITVDTAPPSTGDDEQIMIGTWEFRSRCIDDCSRWDVYRITFIQENGVVKQKWIPDPESICSLEDEIVEVNSNTREFVWDYTIDCYLKSDPSITLNYEYRHRGTISEDGRQIEGIIYQKDLKNCCYVIDSEFVARKMSSSNNSVMTPGRSDELVKVQAVDNGFARIRISVASSIYKISEVQIYGLDGNLIFKIDSISQESIIWSGLDQLKNASSNGIYIAKIRIVNSFNGFERTMVRKLAWLR